MTPESLFRDLFEAAGRLGDDGYIDVPVPMVRALIATARREAALREAFTAASKRYHDLSHHYHDGPGYESWRKCRDAICKSDRDLLSEGPQ